MLASPSPAPENNQENAAKETATPLVEGAMPQRTASAQDGAAPTVDAPGTELEEPVSVHPLAAALEQEANPEKSAAPKAEPKELVMPQGYDREKCMVQLISAVVKSFETKDTSHTHQALEQLGPNAGAALTDILNHIVENSGRSPQITLAELMGKHLGNKNSIALLDDDARAILVKDYCKQLDAWSMAKRDSAAAALGVLHSSPNASEAVKALTDTLSSRWNPLNWGVPFTKIGVRAEAVGSLAKFGVDSVPAIPALNKGIQSWDSSMAIACMKTLQAIAKAAKTSPGTVDPEVFNKSRSILAAQLKYHEEGRFSFLRSKEFIRNAEETLQILKKTK